MPDWNLGLITAVRGGQIMTFVDSRGSIATRSSSGRNLWSTLSWIVGAPIGRKYFSCLRNKTRWTQFWAKLSSCGWRLQYGRYSGGLAGVGGGGSMILASQTWNNSPYWVRSRSTALPSRPGLSWPRSPVQWIGAFVDPESCHPNFYKTPTIQKSWGMSPQMQESAVPPCNDTSRGVPSQTLLPTDEPVFFLLS